MLTITDSLVERVARALDGAPGRAYTTPVVYPWAVQHFIPRPRASRPCPSSSPQRVYVHIPFCNYHCTFCFYAIRTGAKADEMDRYVTALGRELEWVPAGTPLARLIVGGGTPTALAPALLARVLSTVFERMPPTVDASHTLEASPDSLSDAHIRVLHDHGVGRVSIGIESLDGSVLDAVDRRHSPAQALAACEAVTASGLSLNVDLIYGLPGQTEDGFRRDLERVARTGAASLCLYGLRLNDRTVVAAQLAPTEHLDLGRVMRWRRFVTKAAADVGFVETRCYTFKRAGSGPSWHERPLAGVIGEIGLGMSARSQIDRTVYRNHDRTETYLQRAEAGESPVETAFELDAHDLRTQFIARSLGNGRPLGRDAYASALGTSLDADYDAVLVRLRDAELVEDDGRAIQLTELGRLVYDRVLLSFYPARARDWLERQPVTLRPSRREAPAVGSQRPLAEDQHGGG